METALRELPSQLIAQVNELILSKPHEAVDKHVDLIRGAIDVDIVDVNTVLTSRRFYRSSETAVGHPCRTCSKSIQSFEVLRPHSH